MKWYRIACVVLACVLWTNAEGQTTETRLVPPKARPAFEAGVAAFQEKQWDQAIMHFTEALSLAPQSAAVMFDLGLAHAKAGHELPAIAWLESYLLAGPRKANAESVREQIKELDTAAETKIRKIFKIAEDIATPQDDYASWDDFARDQAKAGDRDGALLHANKVVVDKDFDWYLAMTDRLNEVPENRDDNFWGLAVSDLVGSGVWVFPRPSDAGYERRDCWHLNYKLARRMVRRIKSVSDLEKNFNDCLCDIRNDMKSIQRQELLCRDVPLSELWRNSAEYLSKQEVTVHLTKHLEEIPAGARTEANSVADLLTKGCQGPPCVGERDVMVSNWQRNRIVDNISAVAAHLSGYRISILDLQSEQTREQGNKQVSPTFR